MAKEQKVEKQVDEEEVEAPAKKRKHDKKDLNGSVENDTSQMDVVENGDAEENGDEVKSKKHKKKKNKNKDADKE